MAAYVTLAVEEQLENDNNKRYFRVVVVSKDEFVRGDAFRCDVLNELEGGRVYSLFEDCDIDHYGMIGDVARVHVMEEVKELLFQEQAEELEELKNLNGVDTEVSEDELINEIVEDRMDPGATESLVSDLVEFVVGIVAEKVARMVCVDDSLEFGSDWPTIAIVFE